MKNKIFQENRTNCEETEGRISTLFDNSKNLAYPSPKLGPDITGNTKQPEIDMRRRYLYRACKEGLDC